MSEEDAFIRAILAAPEDPAPRLVYADWLEERGDPRGEYLRLTVADGALNAARPAPEAEVRLKELRGQIDPLWIARLHGFNAVPEAVLAERAAAVEADTELLSGYSEVTLDDPATRSALLYYIVLERRPELLAGLNLPDEDLFWNRYYWFLRLKRLHELSEHDGKECEPMAQQAFDMFGEPDGGNYELFPVVEALALRDAEGHFRAGASRKKKRKKKH
jgi:uncharacterized protein (TIGR02996 family)